MLKSWLLSSLLFVCATTALADLEYVKVQMGGATDLSVSIDGDNRLLKVLSPAVDTITRISIRTKGKEFTLKSTEVLSGVATYVFPKEIAFTNKDFHQVVNDNDSKALLKITTRSEIGSIELGAIPVGAPPCAN